LLLALIFSSPASATARSPSITIGLCQPIKQYVNGTTCGTRKVLAILLTWSGASLTTTQQQATTSLFGCERPPCAHPDPRSVESWYRFASYGDFEITGAVTLPYTINKPACDPGLGNFRDSIASQGKAAATAHGYHPASFETIVYDFPANPCIDVGQATPGGQDVWLPDFLGHLSKPFDMYQVTMEITHTLGLAHANGLECKRVTLCQAPTGANSSDCNPDPPPYNCEYGDPWDAMGSDLAGWNYSNLGAVAGEGSFDAIELQDLGWSAGRTQAVDAQADGVYTISPIEVARPSHPQALLIHAASGDFSVEYRQPIGVDQYLACWPLATAGVQVNMRNNLPSSQNGLRQSLLLDMTPNSDGSADSSGDCVQPPKGDTTSHICSQGIAHSATYCDWFDSTLAVGRTWDGPFTLTVRSASPSAARVEIGNAFDSVVIDPSIHDFGPTAPGSTSVAETFTLENLTQQTLHVSSVGLGQGVGSPFTITQDGCSGRAIAPGGSCKVDAEAQPPPGTATGSTLRDVLTFADDWSPLPHQSARLSVFVAGDVSPTGAWFTEQTPGSQDGLEQPEAVACVPQGPSARCWAVGLRYNGTKPNFGTVYANDGGFRWTKQPIPSGVGQLEQVACVSVTRCWATGMTRDSPRGPAIIATTDGGATWVRQHPPSGIPGVGKISCVGASRCWVATIRADTVLATSDGGATWHSQRLPAAGGVAQALDLSFVNTNAGTAVGHIIGACGSTCGGVIWHTTNGGRTWRIQRKGTGRVPSFGAVSCTDVDHCWAAGSNATSGVVFATSNGGATWRAQAIPSTPDAHLESISCSGAAPSVRCWASGYTNSPAGVLLRTVNGGRVWTRQQPPKGVDEVRSIQAVGPLLGWAVAPNELTNDWIIATRSGGAAP
jgi:photosystem II stability/assembly factor-like uncharacterized protein